MKHHGAFDKRRRFTATILLILPSTAIGCGDNQPPTEAQPQELLGVGPKICRLVNIEATASGDAGTRQDALRCQGYEHEVAQDTPLMLKGRVVEFASSTYGSVMFRTSEGVAYCWQEDGSSCWGDGDGAWIAGTVSGLDQDVVDIEMGAVHGCAIKADHSLWCWGGNNSYQVGVGASMGLDGLGNMLPIPVPTRTATDVASVALSSVGGCLITTAGEVQCWGKSALGLWPYPTSVALPGPAIAVAGGFFHACAALVDGTTWCWGATNKLGAGLTTPPDENGFYEVLPAPQQVLGVRDAIALVASDNHTCARLADGDVMCWGTNEFGQLGNGTLADAIVPARVDIENVVELQLNDGTTCGRRADDSVWCWGAMWLGAEGHRWMKPRALME